jgi:hypothetical protein
MAKERAKARGMEVKEETLEGESAGGQNRRSGRPAAAPAAAAAFPAAPVAPNPFGAAPAAPVARILLARLRRWLRRPLARRAERIRLRPDPGRVELIRANPSRCLRPGARGRGGRRDIPRPGA